MARMAVLSLFLIASFHISPVHGASLAKDVQRSKRSDSEDLSPKLHDIMQMLASRQDANALDYILETNRGLGLNLFEGDIKDFNPRHRNSLRNLSALWSARRVPYVIDDSIDSDVRQYIEEAIEEYHSKTCIRWVPRTQQKDYVFFVKLTGCYSAIGRVGNGRQELSLAKPCAKKGTAMHEMLHAVGFFHEHSRPDREPWVQILPQNVESGKEGNFERMTVDLINTLGVQYDYGSIMHYSRYAFSANGQPTILPKQDPAAELGQRTAFSALDLEKINRLYRCDLIPPTAPPASTTGTPQVTQPPAGWAPWESWTDCDLQCRHTRFRICMNDNSSYCPGEARDVQKCAPPCQPAISLGCFANEPSSSAIPSVEGLYPALTDSYRARTAAVRKCADVATSLDYTLFALLDGGQCLTGPEAQKTFNTYGPSSNCGPQGKGGATAMNVYSFSLDMDGGWGVWTDWGQCSQSCGGGSQYRYRRCNSPPPTGHGHPCQGHDAEVKDCNTDRCQTTSKCGVKFHVGTPGKSGYINMLNYDNYMTCDYVIESGEDNDTVSLSVTRMDIEPSQGCIYDALSIFDGVDDTTGRYIGSYCGTSPLPRLQSSGHALFVRFHSDSTTTGAGYTLQFTINAGTRQACVEPRIAFGSFTGSNFVGDTVVFSCLTGFHLSGASSVQCVDQPGMAVWSDSFPHCLRGRKRRSASADPSELCTFDGNLCGFRHDEHARWRWDLKMGDNSTEQGVQSNDNSDGMAVRVVGDRSAKAKDGHYLNAESSKDWLPYDTARIRSQTSSSDDVNQHCLTFRYRLRGNELAYLRVLHATKDDPDGKITWFVRGHSDLGWKREQVEFSASASVQFTFEAALGQHIGSSASIDDVMITKGKCPTI